MTSMIGLICACTVACNLPPVLLKILDNEGEGVALRSVMYLIYWSQFSIDFVLYAASNKQYREAYLLLLKAILRHCYCRLGVRAD